MTKIPPINCNEFDLIKIVLSNQIIIQAMIASIACDSSKNVKKEVINLHHQFIDQQKEWLESMRAKNMIEELKKGVKK